MPDYEIMYYHLFNRVTDAILELEKQNCGNAAEILKQAQREAEEQFVAEETEENDEL